MPNAQDAFWFKSQFQPQIEAAIAGTPFSVDMITAVACQETGGIWPRLRRQGLPTSRILELCVGDTIDATPTGGGGAPSRRTRPSCCRCRRAIACSRSRARAWSTWPAYIPDYRGAASRPDKFCHGFGIFQLDLQFFKTDPDYFLSRRYADFDAALARCVGELKAALRRIGWQGKTSLGDAEMAGVAIAYNTGRYNPAKGLKQGYFDGAKYYGENFFDYLQLAKSARFPAAEAAPSRDARALPTQAKAKRKAAKVAKPKAGKAAKGEGRSHRQQERRRRRRQPSRARRRRAPRRRRPQSQRSHQDSEGRQDGEASVKKAKASARQRSRAPPPRPRKRRRRRRRSPRSGAERTPQAGACAVRSIQAAKAARNLSRNCFVSGFFRPPASSNRSPAAPM